MKHLIDGLHLVATRKDGRFVIITTTIIFMLLLLASQNGKVAFGMFDLTSLSFMRRISLFFSTFFDIRSTFTAGALILAILGSLLGGINLALAYVYVKVRGEMILKSGLYSGIGLLFAFFGIGCAACGTAFLSVILSFFGFSTMLQVLPYQGQEIGYIGLIFLCIATYTLAKKVTAPNVC
jgi:uncharacterized integral membrane protein